MDDEALFNWLTGASPTQFILGVAILIFGTQKILSVENVEKSLGGLLLPVKWLHQKRENAADKEVKIVHDLQEENMRLNKELERYHAWSLLAAKRNRDLEVFITSNGLSVPPPNFVYLHEFRLEEGDDEAE